MEKLDQQTPALEKRQAVDQVLGLIQRPQDGMSWRRMEHIYKIAFELFTDMSEREQEIVKMHHKYHMQARDTLST